MSKISLVKPKPGSLPVINTQQDGPKTFISNAWASVTLILNQFTTIAEDWNSINEVKYKIEKFRVIMQIIYSNSDKMSDGITIIEDGKKRWASAADDDSKAEIMTHIRTEALRLHGLYVNTTAKIADLKVSMSKAKRSLARQQRHQRTNVLGSAINIATNLLDYYAVDELASSTFKIIQGLLVSLVVASTVIHWIAARELSKQRKTKIEILVLDNRIEESKTALDENVEWIELNDPNKLNGQISGQNIVNTI